MTDQQLHARVRYVIGPDGSRVHLARVLGEKAPLIAPPKAAPV
jgi:hypothetical protein